MKILWIINILFPEAAQLLTGKGDLRGSGGWLLGAANALLQRAEVKLYVATVSNLVTELTRLEGNHIVYYILPLGKGNQKVNMDYAVYWKQIHQNIQPDIVHIHGTEFSHGYAYLKACGNANVVLSIQGLTSVIGKYYCAGLSKSEIYRNLTFRDCIKGSLLHEKKFFLQRGVYEKEMIRMANHIIGRTSWDRALIWAINPKSTYYSCNETLRKEFYDGSIWNYNNCHKHSIFLSQAGYPIKGLHQVLKAMPFILSHYPDATIRVAGHDITKSGSLVEKLRVSGYGLYIKRLIKKLHLDNKIQFIGNLNSDEMKREYLYSNVFICPSAIENSPNSLGEAQILGVPCIASYAGGIPDMMIGNERNLYRFEEVEMLAQKVCCIFRDCAQQVDMRSSALIRHDSNMNSKILYDIYKGILG